jgi:hypothetical protein
MRCCSITKDERLYLLIWGLLINGELNLVNKIGTVNNKFQEEANFILQFHLLFTLIKVLQRCS